MNAYIENYLPDKVYVNEFGQGENKYISMIIKDSSIGKTIQIRLTYIKSKEEILGICVAKYRGSEEIEKVNFTLNDYAKFINILEFLKTVDYSTVTTQKINFTDYINGVDESSGRNIIDFLKNKDNASLLTQLLINSELSEVITNLFADESRTELLVDLFKSDVVSSKDIVNIGYRKKQLLKFEELLTADTLEGSWQEFFEENQWVFGYGLNYIFNAPLEGAKMEQVTKGSDITGSGKRPDAFLASHGAISSVCLVEIKRNQAPLLKQVANSYRGDCWQISNELAGAISQSQKTLQKTTDNLNNKFDQKCSNGDPTGKSIYLYQPKTYLLIGSLSEFKTEHGINEEKFSSFQLFRRNTSIPEIITFDELYERAKHIIENNEKM
jgi:hypothetical protein